MNNMLEWKKYPTLEELKEEYGDELEQLLYNTLVKTTDELEEEQRKNKNLLNDILEKFTNLINNKLGGEDNESN